MLICVHALKCVNMWTTVSGVVRETHIKNAAQCTVMLIPSDIKHHAFPSYLSAEYSNEYDEFNCLNKDQQCGSGSEIPNYFLHKDFDY